MASWLGKSGVAIVCDQLTAGGKAVLQKAIRRAGWQTEQFSVCRWDDIPANTRALAACGDRALDELTGWKGGKRASAYTRGYLLPSYSGLPVVPTFDPSKVAMGQMKLLGLVMNDLGVALQAAAGTRKICADPKAIVNYRVGLQALKDLYAEAAANPELLVAFDLETATSWGEDEDESIEFSRDSEEELDQELSVVISDSDSDEARGNSRASLSRDALSIERAGIRTVQFSLRPGTGISCDWSDECRTWVQRIMSLPNPFAGHNQWLFDFPILERHGIRFDGGGPLHDTMWMWHHLQPDLPAHLQGVSSLYGMPFPWKHLSGADLDFYGAADVDAVQRIMLGLPIALRKLGLFDGYEKYVRQFRPVLAAMERRGIPVSKTKLEELRTWLSQEITRMDSELQPMIPSEWKGRKYWKTWPADTKPILAEYKQLLCSEIKIDLLGQGKKVTKKALSPVIKVKDFVDPVLGTKWKERITELGYGWEGDLLYKEVDFNPRSSQQILSYIKAKGYPVPLRFKDKEETTSDKELERLEAKTKDPVLTLVRGIRAYSKMGNAYAGKLLEDGTIEGGWQPGPDGRLRCTVTFGPATGQLAARNPNCMTTPKRRAELAYMFRKCIQAEPNHSIIEIDYRAFHARTLGREAQDAAYYRLADLDVHSFVAGHIVHYPGIETCLSLPDDDLREYLLEIKKKHEDIRNFKAKPCIAEGELVLTDKGLVPIQHVTTRHRVWDGVEWVSHDGVVDQGIKEVMYYDGLWATPEHKVITNAGKTISMRDAASQMERISRSGLEGEEVWINRDRIRRAEATEGNDICVGDMLRNWHNKMGISIDLAERFIQIFHSQWSAKTPACWSIGQTLRRNYSSLQQSIESIFQTLWRSRDSLQFPFENGVYQVGVRESSPRYLQRNGDRSDRQQWPLRTGQFEIGYPTGTTYQSPNNYQGCLFGEGNSLSGISQSIRSQLDQTPYQTRLERGGNNRKIRVYDILNAGPRHRFTVEGRLVLNCILGIGFKMGARRLYHENRDTMANEAEAKRLLDLIKALFKPVFDWQDRICEEADKNGRLINAWGAIRWVHDVFKWQMRDGKWVRSSSKDAEKAVAFLPSSNAHFMLRDKLLQMEERGWLDRYGFMLPVHDALLFHCHNSLLEEAASNLKALLEAPVMQLADPVVAPFGFTCSAELEAGSNWAKWYEDKNPGGMKKLK